MENPVDMTEQLVEETMPQPEVETTSVDETLSGETSSPVENPEEELNRLIEARTGLFEIALDVEDLKWLRNQCNSTFEFNGPNEAFMLMNAHIGLSGAIDNNRDKDAATTKLTASTVEALALLINKYKGKGAPVAHKVFKAAVALQNVIARFRELDTQIDALEKAIQHTDENQEQTAPSDPQ
jgi:hypothetical protein